MFPFQTLFGQRLLLGQHSRIMTADVPFVNFPSFSFENANQTPSRTCSDTVCWVWNQIQLAQRATCALNAPLRDCCEAEGWASRAPGSCAALGALLYLFYLYLGLLSRMSLEQGALKLRSLETSGPMQAFFSQMKRRNPGLLTDGRTLSSVPGKAAELLQQDVTSSLWCLSLHFSMWDSDFYLTGLFWKLNQTH